MTNMKDGEWRSNLKTTHIAKETEYKEKNQGTFTHIHKQPEGAEVKLRWYDYVALNPLFKYLFNIHIHILKTEGKDTVFSLIQPP